MNRELLKFFSGFFFASILLHILIISLGLLPFTIQGMVFDYSFWMITLLSSFFFAIFCSYLGWDRKLANKISLFILFFGLIIVLTSSSYFLDSKNFTFINNKSLLASMSDLKNNQERNEINKIKDIKFEELTYAIALGDQSNDSGNSVVLDISDNIYVTGAFHGTINLDPRGKVEKTSLGGIGDDTDIYVAKYDQYGKYIWGFSVGSIGYDAPSEIQLDKEGFIYIVGYFGGKLDFDPTEKEFVLDAGIGRDGFISKYDSDGRFLWAKKVGNQESIPFENDDVRFEKVSSISFDNENNPYIAGYFNDSIEFNTIAGATESLTASKNSRNIFLAKYDKSGNVLKSLSFGGGIFNEPHDLIVDDDNNIYLAGVFNSKIILNSSDEKKITYVTGAKDIFLAKYDNNLNYLWSKKWGGLGDDNISSFSFTNDKNIVITGSFSNEINFQGIVLRSSGNKDIFFSELDNDGNIIFAKRAGGVGRDEGAAIAIDSLANIYIAGSFETEINFRPSQEGFFLRANSNGDATDAFLSKFDAKGNALWVRSLGGDVSIDEESQLFSDIAIDTLDYPIVVGSFGGEIFFDNNTNLLSKGGLDSLIVKFNPEGLVNN